MIQMKTDYPVFEANQVLTSDHLNGMLDYLDEQSRLTRVTLHGIGAVCGLDVQVSGPDNAKVIRITRGYGVTSEGYLALVNGPDIVADRMRDYKVPTADGYPLLAQKSVNGSVNKYPLKELLDRDDPDNADGQAISNAFLQDKVMMLFVERFEDDLKNCGPTSCDDKGKQVSVTLRALLISLGDLLNLQTEVKQNLTAAEVSGDFFPELDARLGLPDFRLPRLDVPATAMQDGPSIFAAYRQILLGPSEPTLLKRLGDALDRAYAAFKPLLPVLANDDFFSKQFDEIAGKYTAIQTNNNIIFSQYLYDFVGDVLQAYDEFRWQAYELMALCVPPSELFPRHLLLGEIKDLNNNLVGNKTHRHYFRPSPALDEQKRLSQAVRGLFQRLYLLVDQFALPVLNALPAGVPVVPLSAAVKISPSRYGDVALSDKAIPYYYQVDGASSTPSLLEAWNPAKTRLGRAAQNTGYHVTTRYHQPAHANEAGHHDDAVDVAVNPLHLDLERHNFFRIEGHIGRDWREVLKDLLSKIRQYRLPFDVVALNAHPSTVTADVLNDPLLAQCLSNDLQVIYDAWAKELECLMGGKMRLFTSLVLPGKIVHGVAANIGLAKFFEKVPIGKVDVLHDVDITEGTLGNALAKAVDKTTTTRLNLDRAKEVLTKDLRTIPEVQRLPLADYDLAIGKRIDVATAMLNFTHAIPSSAGDLDFSKVDKADLELSEAIKTYRDLLRPYQPPAEKPLVTVDERDRLLRALEDLETTCLKKRLAELAAELERRRKQVEEMIFFSKYARRHPALQHKAGVPSGGTFVLVFQETPSKVSGSNAALSALAEMKLSTANQNRLIELLSTAGVAETADLLAAAKRVGLVKGGLAIPDRVVIADFFLPYRCCSDCAPIQFVLPAARPTFTLSADCPDDKGQATVHFEFEQRVMPCEVKIDDKDYVLLKDDAVRLAVGKHTLVVRDGDGGISVPKEIEILPRFMMQADEPKCNDDEQGYTVRINVTNGQGSLFINEVQVPDTPDLANTNVRVIVAGPYASGSKQDIAVRDSSGCPAQQITVEKACCDLPCNGIVRRCGFRMWFPRPDKEHAYDSVSEVRDGVLRLSTRPNDPIDLIGILKDTISPMSPKDMNDTYDDMMLKIVDALNGKFAASPDDKEWLHFEFEKSDTLGDLLWISRYDCVDFAIDIAVSVSIRDRSIEIAAHYANDGTVLRDGETEPLKLPPLNCSQIDRCDPAQKETKPCQEVKFSPVLKSVGQNQAERQVEFALAFKGTNQPEQIIWEVQDGATPVVYDDYVPKFTFTSTGKKLIRLIAIDGSGCAVGFVRRVNVVEGVRRVRRRTDR